MFVIFYNKETKEIVSFRNDTSTPEPKSAAYHFHTWYTDGKLDASLFAFCELDWNPDLVIGFGTHLYNEATGKIEVNPNYVPPVEPTPTE